MARAAQQPPTRSKPEPAASQRRIADLCRRHKWTAVVATSLAAVTFAVYWQTLRYGFVLYDDPYYVTDNLHVKAGLTWQSILWAAKSFAYANWHPLTWLSLMLDQQVYGSSPLGFHLTNVLLHIANTLLLFGVLRTMTKDMWKSAFVAALFAIHPLHVESVAWVTERKDVLSTLFWLLTMWAYARYAENPRPGRYILVAIFMALGLMAKPMLVTLPFVLLLMDYWPLRRLQTADDRQQGGIGRLILEKVPLLALSAASCIVTMSAQRVGMARLDALPLLVRAENAIVSYAVYIIKMFWPADLACCYLFNAHIPVWQVSAAGVLLVALSVLAIRARERHPYLTVGWLWYVGTLVPVIGLVQVGPQSMADRYTYVPLIGLFAMAAWGVPGILRKGEREKGRKGDEHRASNVELPTSNRTDGSPINRQPAASAGRLRGSGAERRGPSSINHALSVVAVLIVAVLGTCTYRQVQYWQNDETLFQHALDVTGENWIAYNGIGIYLAGKGDLGGARKQYEAALRVSPQNDNIHNNLGLVLQQMGQIPLALHHYEMAMRINPRNPRAFTNLGIALAHQGRLDAAIVCYRKALDIEPTILAARQNLADALMFRGDLDGAVEQYKTVLRWDPRNSKTRCNLAIALSYQGKFSDAESELTQASRLDPGNPQIHTNLAILLIQDGKVDQAMGEAQAAVEARPDFPDAHAVLASVLFAQGKYGDAWSEVHLCRKYGGTPNPAFVKALAAKLPDPW